MPGREKQRKPKASLKNTVKQRQINKVFYGSHPITPWYPSYYHEDLIGKDVVDTLYICPTCFKYTTNGPAHAAHSTGECKYEVSPRGSRCYGKDGYEIWGIDGEEDTLFAQNLSLFGKLFIENKSVCFDVGGFMYYVLVEMGQIVGYFSKEKLSWDNNNLACILVFPPFQDRGCGKMLMACSYLLSQHEGVPGGPERPLSEPGKRSYEAYWSRAIAACILSAQPLQTEIDGETTIDDTVKIQDISEKTAIGAEDVSSTLTQMRILKRNKGGALNVSKEDVRDWVKRTGTNLEPPLDIDHFSIVHSEDLSGLDTGQDASDSDVDMSDV